MSRKVLVVDDSATMRKIVIRALNSVGCTDTSEAADGQQALAAFQAAPFDAVLTDWNMPHKSGVELTREIRAMGSTVPIFMITTEAERSRVLEAIRAGVSDYLVKPFTAESLREKLEKHCA
jgi:two-component system chemotaxis response regulator CheY